MRVLQVDTEHGFRGGQRQVLLLSQGLVDRGHDVIVACRADDELAAACRKAGVGTRPIRQHGPWDLTAAVALASELRIDRFDIVHAHASHALATVATAMRLPPGRRRPRVVVSRRVDFPIGRPPWNRFKYGRLVDRFLAVSEAVADVLRTGGVENERIRVVHSGVAPLPSRSPGAATLRQELGIGAEDLLLINAAALVDHKDHVTSIRAVARVQAPVHLAIAGEGPRRAMIERCIVQEGVAGRITLLGRRDDVPGLLQYADAYLASSHMEGLCTSLMDAGLAGLPVAGTLAGGIPEVVVQGETGLLSPIRDAGALAASIDRLAAEPGLRRTMGAAGRRRIEEGFSAERMIERTLQAYEEVLDR